MLCPAFSPNLSTFEHLWDKLGTWGDKTESHAVKDTTATGRNCAVRMEEHTTSSQNKTSNPFFYIEAALCLIVVNNNRCTIKNCKRFTCSGVFF